MVLFIKFLWINLQSRTGVNNFGMRQSKFSLFHFYHKIRDWGGLWDWEACVRHELGGFDMDTYDNRVKIIKKGQQSWARDGWLTETKWSDRDFIFHGWKQRYFNRADAS
uniref:Uncharacterized protein n=1 Tax=Acrobeloides nanus TaxID=290746 RepID=A0A914D1J3_9BILA